MSWTGVLLLVGLGAWRWLEPRAHRAVPWSHAFCLGAAIAAPVLAIGAAFGALMVVAWLLLPFGAALLLLGIRQRGAPGWIPRPFFPRGMIARVLAAVAVLGWLCALPVCLRPHLNYDVLSYHLPLAHHVRDTGWGYLGGNFYSRLPLGAAVLEAPALSNRSRSFDDPGIRILLWAAAVAASLLSRRLAGHAGAGAGGQWAAAALVAWSPAVWSGLLNAQSDLLVVLFAVGAAERLLPALGTGRPSRFLLAGFLAGSAVSVKFSALGIVALPLCILCLMARRKRVLSPALFTAGLLMAFGIWMVRSSVLSGHPLHPFTGVAAGWTPEQADFLVETHEPITPWQAVYWQDAATRTQVFGYDLVAVPSDPEEAASPGSFPRGLRISVPLVIAVLGLGTRRRRPVALLLAASILGYAAWLLVRQNPERFAWPLSVWLLCASVAVLAPRNRPHAVALIGQGVLALAAFLGVWFSVRPSLLATWSGAFWNEQRDAVIPAAVLESSWREPDRGGLLLLFEARGRWFPEPLVTNTVWDAPPWANALRGARDEWDFARKLRREGITHIFVNEAEFCRLVEFYGGESRPPLGQGTGLYRDPPGFREVLPYYKPFEFARFTPGELDRLTAFLRLCRRQAVLTLPAGPAAEIWFAPIPEDSPKPGSD